MNEQLIYAPDIYLRELVHVQYFIFLLESTHPFLAVFTNQTTSEVFINDVIMWLEVNYIAMGMSTDEVEAMLEPLREKLDLWIRLYFAVPYVSFIEMEELPESDYEESLARLVSVYNEAGFDPEEMSL